MGKRPGAKYVALQRLDALMADEVIFAPLTVQTEQEASLIVFPDGRTHTFEMRTYCQNVVMDFLTWWRDFQDIRDHTRIDADADELVSLFLSELMADGQSVWILRAQRSVLRLYFQDQELAQSIDLLQPSFWGTLAQINVALKAKRHLEHAWKISLEDEIWSEIG